ncbi:MAG: methionine gamma-lyase family protein, partial [Oscillospiraceae bacterium]|nr:methionine gamma-lyase family protein [Oscillospiraceae bacterium]
MDNFNNYKYLEENFGIPAKTAEMIAAAERELDFSRAERIAEYNQFKVLKAFSDNKVSDLHFAHTTGYG